MSDDLFTPDSQESQEQPKFSVTKEQWDSMNKSVAEIGDIKNAIISIQESLRPKAPAPVDASVSVPDGYQEHNERYGMWFKENILLPELNKARAEFRQTMGAMYDQYDRDMMSKRDDFYSLEDQINKTMQDSAGRGMPINRETAYYVVKGRMASAGKEEIPNNQLGEMGGSRGTMPSASYKDPRQATDDELEKTLRAAASAGYKF